MFVGKYYYRKPDFLRATTLSLLVFLFITSSYSCSAFQTPTTQVVITQTYKIPTTTNINYNYHFQSKSILSSTSSTQLYSFWNNDDVEGPDRIKSCIPYLLPLLDGDMFGKYINQRIPPLKFVHDLFLEPLVKIFETFPLLGLVLFLLLSLGPRNVQGMNRIVKFNAQQAVLIDIAIIFPTLIAEGLDGVGIPRIYEEMGNNFVYYALLSAVLYSVIMNLRGKKPSGIPFISDAADLITGPF